MTVGKPALNLSFLHSKDTQLLLVIFIFASLWNLFLIQGLPFFMHGHDDFSMGWRAQRASWSDLTKGLFFERLALPTEENLGIEDNNNFYFGLGYRSTYFIFYKLLQLFDGMQYPDLNYSFRIILFALTSCLLFRLLRTLQINQLFSFGGSLLYTTAVSTYEIVNFIGDLTLYSHFFMLLCFYLFLAKYVPQQKTNPLGISALIFLTGLLALKSKQIAVVVPITIFLYCLLVNQKGEHAYQRRIPVFSLLLLYYLPTPFYNQTQFNLNQILLNFKTYYLYNPWTRIDTGEQLPAILSPLQTYFTVPGSLFGIYKFLLAWVVIILTLSFIVSVYKKYSAKKTLRELQLFPFIILWHTAEVGIMSVYFSPTVYEALRYIGVALPSFIAITFFCMQQGAANLRNHTYFRKYHKIITKIFIIALTLTLLSNMYLSAIPIRGGLLSRHVLIHDSIYTIYKDYFHKETLNDTIFFSVYHWMNPRDAEEKLNQITFTDLVAEFGSGYNQQDLTLPKQKLQENNFIYILTFRSDIPFKNKQLLKKLSACPPETSAYCYLKDKLKGQEVFFHVFKVFKEKNLRT